MDLKGLLEWGTLPLALPNFLHGVAKCTAAQRDYFEGDSFHPSLIIHEHMP